MRITTGLTDGSTLMAESNEYGICRLCILDGRDWRLHGAGRDGVDARRAHHGFRSRIPDYLCQRPFRGTFGGHGKTLTWNLMAAGAVATPAGAVTPVTRFSAGCQSVPGRCPRMATFRTERRLSTSPSPASMA